MISMRIRHFCRAYSFRPILLLLFCPPTQPHHYSIYNVSWNSLSRGFMCRSTSFLAHSVCFSAPKECFLPEECVAIEFRVSSLFFRNKRCMHLCQLGAYKNTQTNVDGLLPKKSSERLTVTIPALCIPLAMKRTGHSATLQKIAVCVIMSCACLTRILNFESDMPKVAGRRPAIT